MRTDAVIAVARVLHTIAKAVTKQEEMLLWTEMWGRKVEEFETMKGSFGSQEYWLAAALDILTSQREQVQLGQVVERDIHS